MAFYIKIEKISDDENKAEYRFTGDHGRVGRFEIDKPSGEVQLLEEMGGDSGSASFKRASMKIKKSWMNGVLPDFAEWASQTGRLQVVPNNLDDVTN